jgi:hypothetical protein
MPCRRRPEAEMVLPAIYPILVVDPSLMTYGIAINPTRS